MKSIKRVFSLFLVVCILAGIVPTYADTTAGDEVFSGEQSDIEEPITNIVADNPAPVSYSASSSAATSGQCGDNVYWSFDEATGTLTISGAGEMWAHFSGDDPPTWYALREYINNVEIKSGVTSIVAYAFEEYENLTSITIPETVEEIGWRMIAGCEGLKTAGPVGGGYDYEFGWTTQIPDFAFGDCDGLVSVNLPEGISRIGKQAFQHCNNLSSINIPSTVVEIGSSTFENCESLKTAGPIEGNYNIEIALKDTIPSYTFDSARCLESVVIPEGITTIKASAFRSCSSLSHVIIPSSVSNVEKYVFRGCDQLVSAGPAGQGYNIEFDWIQQIPQNAFFDHDSLESVTLPDGMKAIGESAFDFCSSLKNVIIPDSVIQIGERAFAKCEKLSAINLPSSLEEIGGNTFLDCVSLRSIVIPGSVLTIEENTFSGCTNLMTVKIHEGVTSVKNRAFKDCTNLISIQIPKSLTQISFTAFDGCISLKTAGPAGRGYNFEFNWVSETPSGSNSPFFNNTNILSVTIPSNIQTIQRSAFTGCSNLANIFLADGVESIGSYAFSDCSSLVEVVFPRSITDIDDGAFSDCNNLQAVKFYGDEPQCTKADFATRSFPKTTVVYYVEGTTGWTESNNYDPATNTWNGYKLETWDPSEETVNNDRITLNSVPYGKYLVHVVDSSGKSLPGAEVVYDGRTQYTDINGDALFDSLTISTPTITVSLAGYETWTNANSNWEKSESRYETIVLYSEAEGAYKLDEALYSGSEDMSRPCNLLTKTKTVSKLNTGNLVGDFGLGTFFISCRAIEENYVNVYQLWQGEKMIAESSVGFFELNVDSFEKGGDCFIRVIAADGTEVDTAINLQIDENEINKNSSIEISKGTLSFKVGDDVPFIGGQDVDIKLPDELPIDFEFTDTKIHIGFNLKKFDSSDTNEKKEDKWDSMKGTLEALAEVGKQELSRKDREKLESLIQNNKSIQLPGTGSLTAYVLGYAEADWGSNVAEGALYLIVSYSTRTYGFNTVVAVVPVTVQVKASASVTFGGDVSYNWVENTFDTGVVLDLTVGLNAFGGVGAGKLAGVGAYGDAKLLIESQLKGTDPGVENVDLTGELGLKAYVAWFTYERAFAHRTWHIYTQNNARAVEPMSNSMDVFSASNYAVEQLDYLTGESGWMGYPISTFAADASTSFKTLVAGTYRNAQPVILSDGNRLYAAFLRADANTNQIRIAVSVFDGDGWSEPVIADNSAVLDDAPQLLSNGGQVWLAYAATGASADTSSMMSYAVNQSIIVGSIDANGGFTRAKAYDSAAETYAHMQTLAVVNGVPTLFWVESVINDEDDIFSSTSNTVKYAVYSNGSWGDAETLATINHPIRQLAAGGSGVACNIDTDDNLNTTDDLQLTAYSISGSSSVIANGVTGNVTYGVLPGTSAEGFIWNGDGALYCGSSSIAAPGITNEYSIVGDSIYYSSNEEGGTVLTLLKYDGANWSEPIGLISSADESRYLENLSAAELNGKDYIFGMNTAVDISADSVSPDKNLVWASVNPVSDLRIDGVEYDTDVVTPGENVPVTLTVVNGGDHAVSGLQVTVDGVTQDIGPMDLGVGESADIAINIPCPSTETTYKISVTAASEPLADDFNPDDNSYQLVLGLTNLVANLTYEQIGTSRTLVAAVTNEGINPTSGTVTFYDANGAAHGETTFSDLESGGVVVVRLPLADSFAGKYDGGDVSVTVEAEQSELYEFDNRATAHIYESTGTSITSVESSGSYVEAQVTYYGEQTGVTVYCAFYDAQGRMLSTEQRSIGTGTQSIRFSNVTDATTAKVFVLDAAHSPLCQAKEVTL